jgi:hypothetical protein
MSETCLVQDFAILVQTRVDGFEVFLCALERLLEGVLELCKGHGRRVRV